MSYVAARRLLCLAISCFACAAEFCRIALCRARWVRRALVMRSRRPPSSINVVDDFGSLVGEQFLIAAMRWEKAIGHNEVLQIWGRKGDKGHKRRCTHHTLDNNTRAVPLVPFVTHVPSQNNPRGEKVEPQFVNH